MICDSRRRSLYIRCFSLLLASACGAHRSVGTADAWHSTAAGTFEIAYTAADASVAPAILGYATNTPAAIQAFFQEPMDQGYRVRLFPDGASLRDYWRAAWNQPGFARQCWMVAAAGAAEMQILSPRVWARDACGHNASDADHVMRIVTHEAVHVFHRRVNPSPTFLNQDASSWFVEGIASYASGQLSAAAIADVQTQLLGGYTPASLPEVLSGRLGYSGAAALVRYIDERYGRSVIRAMMRDTSLPALLQRTGRTEQELLSDWIASVRG